MEFGDHVQFAGDVFTYIRHWDRLSTLRHDLYRTPNCHNPNQDPRT